MGLAIDGEAPAGNIGLDGLLSQIYPDLPDAGLIQIIHVYMNRCDPRHLEQEVEVIVHLDSPRAGRTAQRSDSPPRSK